MLIEERKEWRADELYVQPLQECQRINLTTLVILVDELNKGGRIISGRHHLLTIQKFYLITLI